MRRGILTVLTMALLIVFATSASAYDFLYTGDTAMTHDAGAFGFKAGIYYLMADEYFDADGEKQDLGCDWTAMWFPVNLFYSPMDQLELGINAKFAMLKCEYEDEETREEEVEGTGIGDTWIWAKYMFMAEPMMTGRLGVKVATGDDEPDEDELATGEGQMDIDGAIMFGMPAGPGMFDAAVGYRYRMAREVEMMGTTYDYTPGSEIHFYAAYTYYLNEMMNLKFAADGFFGSDDDVEEARETIEDSASNGVWINPGFEYMMENGMMLGIDMHYPLMGQNLEAEWGFSAYFGMMM